MQTGDIHDVLAIVGNHRPALGQAYPGRAAQGCKLARNTPAGHRDDLHRKRETAQCLNQLGLVRDADKTRGLCRDDLLARQCGPPALDHVTPVVYFVGAIDVHRQLLHIVAIEHGDTQRAQALGTGFRTRHCAPDLVLDGSQRVNELIDRGAASHTDHLSRHHILQGGLAHHGLEFILGQHRNVGTCRRPGFLGE